NSTLDKVKSLWSDIIINLDEIDTNQFLRQYMCMLLQRRVTIKGLVEEFKYYYVNHVQNSELISVAELYVEDEELTDEDIEDFDINETGLHEEIKVNRTEKVKKISIVNFLKQVKEASLLYRKIRLREFGEDKINYRLQNLQRI